MIRELHEDEVLASFFRADPFLHLYELGDLDDFFRPHARWWGLFEPTGEPREEPCQVVLFYDAGSLPVLLAFTRDPEGMCRLVRGIRDRLPGRFYAHLSPGVEAALSDGFRLESHGRHLRMGLIDESRLRPEEGVLLLPLTGADLPEVLALFDASYPGNWFDPRMLDTGQYLGARIDGRLCAVAGVHVFSARYRVAALGNITTRPQYRGRGLAGLVTGALCRRLREHVDWIGLNVHADNVPAVACYRRLGFARIADYEEFMVERAGES